MCHIYNREKSKLTIYDYTVITLVMTLKCAWELIFLVTFTLKHWVFGYLECFEDWYWFYKKKWIQFESHWWLLSIRSATFRSKDDVSRREWNAFLVKVQESLYSQTSPNCTSFGLRNLFGLNKCCFNTGWKSIEIDMKRLKNMFGVHMLPVYSGFSLDRCYYTIIGFTVSMEDFIRLDYLRV